MGPYLPYDPPVWASARFLRDNGDPDRVKKARRFGGILPFQFALGEVEVDATQWGIMSDLYDAEIASEDMQIASLVGRLAAEDLLENTLLIITSDHGENLGDHGLADHMFSLHRTLLHVPLLIRFPEKFAPGSEVDQVLRLEDLFPTILSVCGLSVPPGIDGISLLSPIPGRIAKATYGNPFVERLEEEHPDIHSTRCGMSIRSVYDGRHHLILYSGGQEELYDVRADPAESENLAPAGGEVLQRMRSLMESP